VQNQVAQGGSVVGTTGLSATLGTATVAGNALFAFIAFYHATVAPTVTDSRGNTWVLLPGHAVNSNGDTLYMAYALNCAGGATVITVKFAGTQGVSMVVGEYKNVQHTSALDSSGTGSNSTTTGGAIAMASLSPTLLGELQIGALAWTGCSGVAAGGVLPAHTRNAIQALAGAPGVIMIDIPGTSQPGSIMMNPTFTGGPMISCNISALMLKV
jgi:hypothetical protein